ncbi:MAG: choice-of-anchor J domain-containing protein [Chloroflexota bacterium]
MKRRNILTLGLVMVLLITACVPSATPTTVPPTTSPEPTETPKVEPVQTEPPAVEPTEERIPTWPESIAAEEDLSRTPVSAEEQATFDLLALLNFVENDPIQLGIAVEGVPGPVEPIVATEVPVLREGTVETFWVHNNDTNEWSQIEARLERVTEHAYFWFDTSRELVELESINRAAEAFEQIYEQVRAIYGSEWTPGIDGDPHIYILHPRATVLCNVDETTAHQCTLLGYYSSNDELPISIEPHSNQHEMFIMNMDKAIGGDQYLTTLAHEFRHMIEYNYDRHDDDWVVEGTAMMVEDMLGYKRDVGSYGSDFTGGGTDLQLNVWGQGYSAIAHYGQSYTFTRYIYNRLGDEFYGAWVKHPDRAFFALDAVLQEQGYDFTAHDLWLDWTAAVSLIDFEGVPALYSFGEEFYVDPPKMEVANKFPRQFEDTVNQYAFDLYDVRSDSTVKVNFVGMTKVLVLENVLPASGQYMWWSGRANQSDMWLTRELDLSGVGTATLNYSVFYSLEKGYDFAYVLVSTDGGETWQSLVTENMQGDKESDDPGDQALTERFYTSRTNEWVNENVDLSEFAGQKILLRFQYITDAIYTGPGIALDNISVPEIGFFDDVETLDEGWEAQGFVGVTAYEPQAFYITLITFDAEGVAQVQRIVLAEDNTASFEIPLNQDSKRALVLVAAANPLIITPAHYQLSFEK